MGLFSNVFLVAGLGGLLIGHGLAVLTQRKPLYSKRIAAGVVLFGIVLGVLAYASAR